MPEEIQQNPSTPQAASVQSASNANIILPPDADPSLDNALEKMFNNNPEPIPNEKPIEESKPNSDKPVEIKTETTPKQDKNVINNDPLPDPDKIENNVPKKQDGWNSLKNNYKRAHKVIAERDQEIIKLKSSLSERGEISNKEVEALKKQIQELSGYRAMIDIQADPEFVSKFDAPFNKNVESIKSMLEDMNVSKEVIKGVNFSDTKYMKYLIGLVMTNKDTYTPDQLYTSKKLQTKIEDLIELSEKRDESIMDQKTKHKEYLENKKKESFTKTAETEGKMIKRLEEVGKNIPFLNKMDVKEGATSAEIENVDKHNKMVDAMSQKVQQVLKMDLPEQKAEVAIAAVASHYFNAQLKDARDKIASLENELKKISAVSSDAERTRQPAGGTTRRSHVNGNGEIKDVDTSLNEYFAGLR